MIKGNRADRTFTVYIHKSPSGKAYVGITCQEPHKRWGKDGHKYFVVDKQNRSPHIVFANAIKKHGWDSFQHIIIAKGIPEDRAKKLEQSLIRHYKNLGLSYNVTDGGEGSLGRPVSEEMKEKLRQYHLGKKHSEEEIEKIRLKSLARKHTEEEKAKMSKALKGRVITEEWRKKISESLKGRPGCRKGMKNSPEIRAKISATKKANPRHHTKEEKEHLSKLLKGRKNSPETIEKM